VALLGIARLNSIVALSASVAFVAACRGEATMPDLLRRHWIVARLRDEALQAPSSLEPWSCLQRGRAGVPRGLYPKIIAEVRAGGPKRLAPINNLEAEMRRHPPGWLR